jgi:hypothetical protein
MKKQKWKEYDRWKGFGYVIGEWIHVRGKKQGIVRGMVFNKTAQRYIPENCNLSMMDYCYRSSKNDDNSVLFYIFNNNNSSSS